MGRLESRLVRRSEIQDFLKLFDTTFNVSVGSGQDYPTFTAAVEDLSKWRADYVKGGVFVTVTAATGYVWEEEFHVFNKDLSWMMWLSADATVGIGRDALVTALNTYNGSPSAVFNNTRAAIFGYRSRLPRIGIKFDMDTEGTTSADYAGIWLHGASDVHVLDGCGVVNVVKPSGGYNGRGINVSHNSSAVAWGSVWDGCEIGIRVSNSSQGTFRECSAVGCDYGADINGASRVAMQDSVITGCTYSALWAQSHSIAKVSGSTFTGNGTGGTSSEYSAILNDGSLVDADETDVSDSGRGITTLDGGTTFFKAGVCDGTVGNGLTVLDGGRMIATSGTVVSGTQAGSAVAILHGGWADLSDSSVTNNTAVTGVLVRGGEAILNNTVMTGNASGADLEIEENGRAYAFGAETTNGAGTINLSDTNLTQAFTWTEDGFLAYDTTPPAAGGVSQLIVPVHSAADSNVTMTNQANAEQFLGNSNRNIIKVDLTNYTQVRLVARVVTASASANSPRIYAEYHTSYTTTVGTYSDIGTSAVTCSLSSAGYVDSGWVDLAAGAKADVFVTVLQNGGDAAADPAVAAVYLHFK